MPAGVVVPRGAMAASRFEFRAARPWRFAVLALSVLVLVVSALWVLAVLDSSESWLAWLALPSIPLAWWARAAGRHEGVALREEGGHWWLEARAGSPEPAAGTLIAAFDFGSWMLLRFDAGGSRCRRWLAPSRADLRDAWPAFRRAVYSPRPTPAGRSAQAPADPPA